MSTSTAFVQNGITSNQGPPITSYPGWSVEIFDAETVASWRIGEQLTYSLLIEANHPGHKDGLPLFHKLINNLHIDNQDEITVEDTKHIFDYIVRENKPKLLAKVMNNACIPQSNFDGNIAKSALKQAIRVGAYETLQFMIEEKVTMLSNDTNSFDDIKSIIFNILRCLEIDDKDKQKDNRLIAHTFWKYLAKCFYETYTNQQVPETDEQAHSETDEQHSAEEEKEKTKWRDEIINEYDYEQDAIEQNKQCQWLMKHALIRYAIYKKIQVSSIGKKYIYKLLPILYFLCEHHMRFDDGENLRNLHAACMTDKLCDCSTLIAFELRVRGSGRVQLFWSEYVTLNLIDDYLATLRGDFAVSARGRAWSVNSRRKNSKKKEEEREAILDGVRYLIANGVAEHLDDVVLPRVKEQYESNEDMERVLSAIEYGRNVWTLRRMKKDEVFGLFDNVCNRQIELPQSLCAFILSFVVL